MTRRVYRTMQGREVDMDQLLQKNETVPAVGNVRMNARGDLIGPGGKVIQKEEEQLVAPPTVVPNRVNVEKNVDDMDPEGNE